MTVLPREKRKKGTAAARPFHPRGPRVTLAPGWGPSPRAPPSSLPLLPLATSPSPPVCIAFPSSPRVSPRLSPPRPLLALLAKPPPSPPPPTQKRGRLLSRGAAEASRPLHRCPAVGWFRAAPERSEPRAAAQRSSYHIGFH
ncbi:hypothetical protein PAHAL_1G376700 [Panicum hallii]|uniref:Uncharacterized protein n=1 Tax=Panicum hallii TaxID=206008 RepID=A0A2T8KXI2_9POAL|nr:hypothetical protein PAHAL_1G376700 [Panicum hallii]